MHDYHTHIGQFNEVYYDYHDVLRTLKNNGITEATLAYLTPRFDNENYAKDFYFAVRDELKDVRSFANRINIKINILYWADPLVLKSISLDKIFSDFNYSGIALHPGVHSWTKDFSDLLSLIFCFAKDKNIPLFIHTGVSEYDNPLQFEKWFANFPTVSVQLAHCKDSKPIIELFSKYKNLTGDTAFCPADSYKAICAAGFKHRMYFGSDFPITHYYHNKQSSIKRTLDEQYKIDCSFILEL